MRYALVILALVGLGLTSARVSAQLIGPQSVLVNPINTVNEPTQTYTQAELQAVFAPGSEFVRFWCEQSYGSVCVWNVEVWPWATYPAVDYSTCNYPNTLHSYASQRMRDVYGYGVIPFSRWLEFFPRPNGNCTEIGFGGGGYGSIGILLGRWGLGLFAHELGHGFGLQHTNIEVCNQGNCAVSQRDERYSSVSSGSYQVPYLTHFPAADKMRLGWMNVPGKPRSLGISTSGDYTVEPFEVPLTSTGVVALVVQSPIDPLALIVEARTKGDWYGANPGVIIRSSNGDPKGNILLDLTKNGDYVLDPGQTYNRPDLGFSISTLAFGVNGATVRVTYGKTCPIASCAAGAPGKPVPAR